MTRRKGGLADREINPGSLHYSPTYYALLLPGVRSMIAYKIDANKIHMYSKVKLITRKVKEVS